MRNVAVLIIMSLLASHSSSLFAVVLTADSCRSPENGVMKGPGVSYNMFDGIHLTGQQRQQMRDLMRQSHYDRSLDDTAEIEALHRLIVADEFDEAAVRMQMEKVAQVQVNLQFDMARVYNQMYQLLSSEQKSILVQRHKQCMHQLMSRTQSASTQKMSESE